MSDEPAAGPATAPAGAAVSPLGPEQLQQLAAAERRRAGLTGAVKLAAWNGYGLCISAGLCLLSAIADPWLLLTAAVLGGFGYAELRGRKHLQRYDARALSWLCINQVGLMLVTVCYALWQLHAGTTGEAPLSQALREHPELQAALASGDDPQVAELAHDVGDLYRKGVIIAYVALIALSVLMQGGSALYYRSRRPVLEAFLRETPPWVHEVHRTRV
ncbi:MAG TPA: hypothetical protein VF331_12275 [Polyangiales bacterium]